MAWRPGKKQLTKAVSLDAEDIHAFRQLDKLGVKLDLRVVASDPSVNILDKIAEQQNKTAPFLHIVILKIEANLVTNAVYRQDDSC
jgi:hypothetical protein